MTTLVHKGIRPEFKTREKTIGAHVIQIEKMPDKSKKWWTGRMLTSGCNKEVSEVVRKGNLIYCPHCVELFSANQFKEK